MLWFFAGLVVGVLAGMVLMAALVASGRARADRPTEAGQLPTDGPPPGPEG